MTVQTQQRATKKEIAFLKNWTDATATLPDQVIDAFLVGKEKGRGEMREILNKLFVLNMEKTTATIKRIISDCNDVGISISESRLRVESIGTFDVLFIVDEAQYLSENFRNAYLVIRKIINEVNVSDYTLHYSFVPRTQNIDMNCIISDGYRYKYGIN